MDSVEQFRDFLDALEELVRKHRSALEETQEIDVESLFRDPDVFDWVLHVRKTRKA